MVGRAWTGRCPKRRRCQTLSGVSGAQPRDARGPTIGNVADALPLRHHRAVGLIDRAEAAGLVRRRPDRDDQRVVWLTLTRGGARRLSQLSERHLAELDRINLGL